MLHVLSLHVIILFEDLQLSVLSPKLCTAQGTEMPSTADVWWKGKHMSSQLSYISIHLSMTIICIYTYTWQELHQWYSRCTGKTRKRTSLNNESHQPAMAYMDYMDIKSPIAQNWLLSFTLPKWLRPDDPLAVWACLCYHLSEASQAVQGDLFQLECGEQSQRTNIQVLNEFNQHVSSMALLLVSCFIQCLTLIKLKYLKYLKPDDGVAWWSITISGLKIQRFGSTSRFRGMWLGS